MNINERYKTDTSFKEGYDKGVVGGIVFTLIAIGLVTLVLTIIF